jgi:hypothetical protein
VRKVSGEEWLVGIAEYYYGTCETCNDRMCEYCDKYMSMYDVVDETLRVLRVNNCDMILERKRRR